VSRGRDEPAAQPLNPDLTARATALAVVARCLEGKYLAPALRQALDASGLEGADRSLVTDLSYGTLRRLLQLDAALAPYLKAPGRLPPRVLVALRIGAYELLQRGTPAYAAVSAWVELVKHDTPALAPLANAVLRRVARLAASQGEAGSVATESVATEAAASDESAAAEPIDPERDLSLPAWLHERFAASLGEDAARRAALGMLEPEPLWLTPFSDRAERVLLDQGCEVGAGPLTSLRVRAPTPLDRLVAFRDGLVQPQNPSSLYAARLLGAGPGDTVFDLASGQGVKTAVLAAGGAEVIAVERSQQRVRSARSNLRRLGLSVRHVVADLVTVDPEVLFAESGGPVAKVLLDAPCTGTGTLRGHPEIKLRLTAADVDDLARIQSALLDTAARLVAVGGRLLYAVCSLMPEEGPLQMASFLARHDGFAVRGFTPPLPFVAAKGELGNFVLPVNGLDGFFLCVLERVREAAFRTDPVR